MDEQKAVHCGCLNDGSRVHRGSTGNQGGPLAALKCTRSFSTQLRVSVYIFPVMTDNQSVLKLLKNHEMSMRSNHIDVVYHFARERVARQDMDFSYIRTDA